MRNVLVTGANGFVGSNLVKRLLEMDTNIVVGTHVDELNYDRLEYQYITEGVKWAKGTIDDRDFIERVINMYEIDTIFHMAAQPIVRIAMRNPRVAFKTNIEGTWNILEAARTSGTVKAFVGASSDKAYGDHKELPYKETFSLNAVHTYDASKACADILMRTYAHNYGMPVVVTRSCNIYGPGDFNYSRIIPNSIRRLLNNESPLIWKGVNEYVREFVYVQDLVKATIMLAGQAERKKGQAFNISTGDIWKVEDLINHVAKVMGKDIKATVVEKELEFMEIEKQYLEGSKIFGIGWTPDFTFDSGGAEETIRWYTEVFSEGIK